MTPRIELSPGELAVAQVIASLRQAVNREAGRVNLKAGPQDPMITELVGIYGEVAFARWANVFPDLSVHLRAGSFDATWLGWSVDVKSSRNASGPLWVDSRKRPDVYVLALVEGTTVTLAGWMPAGEAHATPRAQVPQDELYPMATPPEPAGG
jgi:hypothetical protein